MAAEETPTPPAQLTSPPEPILLSGPDPHQHQLPEPKPMKPPQSPAKETRPAEETGKPDEKKPAPKGRLGMIALVTAIVLAVLLVIGLLPRLSRTKEVNADAKKETQANALPTVNTVAVQSPPPFDDLLLPGNIQAVQQTAIVARSSGYLKRSYVDIGDKVRAGQLLATIATPDLDQQVAQARAQVSQAQAAVSQAQANLNQQQANFAQGQANLSRAQAQYEQSRTDLAHSRAALAQAQEASAQQDAQLAQAQANLNLARVTAQRYRNLLAEGAIDQQTTDQSVAAEQTNTANVQALSAALRASKANTRAFSAAVESSQANVSAYSDGIRAGRAAVGAAAANVSSARAVIRAAEANVSSAQANFKRTKDLQGFQNVFAPFAGIITARNVDTGALIATSGSPSGGSSAVGDSTAGTSSLGNAASGSASAGSSPSTTPGSNGSAQSASLFSLAQLGVLRIYLNVPQTYLGVVGVGQQAKLTVKEMPGQTFTGTVTRSAGALDAASRTLVTEVRLANPTGALKPGMFAEVHLRVSHPGSAVTIPGTALITNASGTQVALVGGDGKVHFQPVTVGHDFGETIEVTQGLQAQEQIISTPRDSLHEGQKVKVNKAKPAGPKPG